MFGLPIGGSLPSLSSLLPSAPPQPSQSPGPLRKLTGLISGKHAKTTASISSLGQLLTNLEQLQAKDPAKFQQVVAGIASKLQAAAKQAGPGSEGKILADLAAKFQNIAAGGSLAQLVPQESRSYPSNPYANAAQKSTATLLDLTLHNSNQAAGKPTNLQQLFASINNDVGTALKS